MLRRLIYTTRALDDLEAMRAWLSQPGSGRRAKRRAQLIAGAISRLIDTPYLYSRGEHAGTRKIVVERHVVVYKVEPDTGSNETAGDVTVLRVFGPGQLVEL